MTFEQIQFGGKAHAICEDELRGSLTEDQDSSIITSLWQDYLAEGKAKNIKAWLRPRLKELFKYADQPPRWVEDRPSWPFFEGRPMIFIEQIEPAAGAISAELLCQDHVLYVFGARQYEGDGWRMVYRVLSQNRTVRGIVAVPKQ